MITGAEAKSVVELIRGATIADIAVVSFVVLPILIGAWILLFTLMGALPQSLSARLFLAAGLVIFYIGAIAVMKRSENARSRKLRVVKRIYNTLERRRLPNQGFGSFNYIRERVDEALSDRSMLDLIEEFPDFFVRGKTKDGKDAIKIVPALLDEEN
jgi:hypothetical protein